MVTLRKVHLLFGGLFRILFVACMWLSKVGLLLVVIPWNHFFIIVFQKYIKKLDFASAILSNTHINFVQYTYRFHRTNYLVLKMNTILFVVMGETTWECVSNKKNKIMCVKIKWKIFVGRNWGTTATIFFYKPKLSLVFCMFDHGKLYQKHLRNLWIKNKRIFFYVNIFPYL